MHIRRDSCSSRVTGMPEGNDDNSSLRLDVEPWTGLTMHAEKRVQACAALLSRRSHIAVQHPHLPRRGHRRDEGPQ